LVAETISALNREGRILTQTLPSSIPEATVQRLLVKQGQQVSTGQPLAIIASAGKPPLQLWSQADGTIETLNVTVGSLMNSEHPFGVIRMSPTSIESAIGIVITTAVATTPSQILAIVNQATYASPNKAQVIVSTAKEACPARAAVIEKAAAAAIPQSSASAPTTSLNTNAPGPNTATTPPHVNAPPPNPFNEVPNRAQKEIQVKMQDLKEHGKLTDPTEVGKAVKEVIAHNTVTKEIPAPLGAKVIEIYKKKGDVVHPGDKIVLLRMPDGKEVPIIAKEGGIMQGLNVSKGGVIGNTRPRSVFQSPDKAGVILIAMSPQALSYLP
jgi:pyruvate/2-oxoglutarate dehydrogenase complex dihydrolipoamide acyltransferase (E2) component